MAKANILIVEDESIIALDIKRSLLGLGYQVLAIADNGEEAIALTGEQSPDLVLMDIRLRGDMDGMTAALRLREQHNVPVIFLTAHADEATLRQATTTTPFGYIVKPFETHALTTTIEVALTRHRAEQAIQRMLETERELNALKSQFIAIISHEFRNPLSSIQFCLDLLERQDTILDLEKRRVYFQRARNSIDRLKSLLEDVLVLGEMETKGLSCQPSQVDVLQFCAELVEEVQSVLTTPHQITFLPHPAESEQKRSPQLLAHLDIKLLRHILVNLLSNAVKYSPQGGTVKLEVQECEGRIVLQVQDEGIGIPAEDQSRLFVPFYRAANVNTIPGTGLGLCIVKKCIDAHGGDITIHSQVGVGSTFTVILNPILNSSP